MFHIDNWVKYYEKLFLAENNQQNFFIELTKNSVVPKILSLECGAALVSMELAKEGIDITITDTFLEFINHVNNRMESHENLYHSFQIKPQDLIRYLAKNYFDVIACCNYRLIFLQDKAQILKLLFDAKVLLKKGGYLVFDLINFAKYDFSQNIINLPQKECSSGTLNSTLVQNKETTSYIINQTFVTNKNKHVQVIENEPVYPITIETLQRLSKEAEFSDIKFYSDWNKSPYSKESDKLICVLTN